MDKIIFIVLIIIIIILIIKVYEDYTVIQILLNKVSELDRELFVLKNKEKIKELKKAIKDSSISIEDFIEEGDEIYAVDNEIYFEFKEKEKEKEKEIEIEKRQ